MILHCTQKLAGKLADVSPTPLAETSPMGSWHANLYTIDRRLCVIFCHDATRYCLFLPGLRKVHFTNLGFLHRDFFLASLAAQGVRGVALNRVAMVWGPARFDRGTDRSVLGSLRVTRMDLGFIMPDINVMDCDPLALSLRLNDRHIAVKGKTIFPAKAMLALIGKLGDTARRPENPQ